MIPPLKFVPIFKTMLWGGQRLPGVVGYPGPAENVGEAWVLSDVDGSLSVVADGPFAGRTLRDVLQQHPQEVFGANPPADGRFPLLLKFIDAKQELSVQVHPNDEQAVDHKGQGHRGKTEAWVILDANPATSRIYAGFADGHSEATFRDAMATNTVPGTLHTFTPEPGDCVFLEAGTVHAIGADILLFEVQQTSDITYRLFDWNRVDAKSGQPRDLHIDHGLTCSDFERGPCQPVTQVGSTLVDCPYFTLNRYDITKDKPLTLPDVQACRVLVGTSGNGVVNGLPLRAGEVLLLPACIGSATVTTDDGFQVLECGLGTST
jgi:mannose-6-phosphate isomerase